MDFFSAAQVIQKELIKIKGKPGAALSPPF
jgi:hypothetical protein